MKTTIYKNYSEFLNRADKEQNGVSEAFAKENSAFEKSNLTNKACWNCCGCSDCSDCSDCCGKKEPKEKSWFDVPVIEGIHQKILAAVKAPDALDMSTWHKCDTTHCRGGWVVTLAGDKGRKLEAASNTLFAAMQIYKASSAIRVSPVRFFETDKVAMADVERCAKLEADAK